MRKTLATLVAAAGAVSGYSAIIIDTEPGALLNTENILLNDTGLLSQGPVVQGLTSDSLLVVDYYGAGEDLLAGKARVMGVDGGITQLSIAMNDPSLGFEAYQFNVDALGTGDLTVSVYDHGMLSLTETISLNERGPNFVRVYATEGEAFSEIMITSTVDLASVRQNRAYAVPNPVPEPAGMLALALGLTSLAGLRKRQ